MKILGALLALAISQTALASPADLELDRASEPALSRGVMSLSRSEFQDALNSAEAILKTRPKCLKALELRALALKGMNRENDALATYQRAALAIVDETRNRDATAPYVFEIGLIRLRQKKREEARDSFQFALDRGFNTVASHFFLGTLDLEENADLEKAEGHFREVLASNVEDLKPSAAYYLGQAQGKKSDSLRSSRNFLLARYLSAKQLQDTATLPETRALAGRIYNAVKPLLEPLSGSHWFGNFALLTAYDSNVLDVPSSDGGGGPSQGSLKEALRFGLGYAGSTLSTWQFVPSYQGGVNYNFNQETKSGQFFTHDVEVYATKDPLSATSWGIKAEGIAVLQYQKDPDTDSSAFSPYSLTGMAGPYYRKEISPRTLFSLELYAGYIKNYLDASVSEVFRRTGPLELLRLALRKDTRSTSWNPGIALTLEAAQPSGTEFKSQAATLQLSDRLFLGDRTTIGASFDLGYAMYGSRPGQSRHDELVATQANLNHNLPGGWSILAGLQVIQNFSNIESTYQYSRIVMSAGAGFSF